MQTMSTQFTLLVPLWLLGIWHHSLAYLPLDDDIEPFFRQSHITNYSAFINKRDSPVMDYNWKTTSKPKFVTGKLQKVEPILTVYPPDVVYRHGRGRELVLQPHQQPDGLKRVIYYATLPEISRYMPPVQDHRYTTASFGSYPYHQPVPYTQQSVPYTQQPVPYTQQPVPFNNQRSYDPNKAGKDFVTRVQSTVIDVRPRGDKKKDYQPPSFTIIDANPTYPDLYDRVTILNGGEMLDGKDKYGVLQGYGGNSVVEHVPPLQTHRPLVTPYAMNPNLYYNMRPYHTAEMQKLVAVPGITAVPGLAAAPLVNNVPNLYTTYTASNLQNPPPYPTRHNRFPTNRYPTNSPLAAILGSPQRPAADIPEQPHRFQPATGVGGQPPTSNWVPTSNLEVSNNLGSNDNLGPSQFDQPAPVDNPSLRPLSYKNKFATHLDPYDNGSPFGQKYTDFGTFNTDFSITKPNGQMSFKPHFSQVSDWLTNKPSLDISQFELEDFNNVLASNAAATGQDSSSSMPTSPAGGSANLNPGLDMFSELNNTIITPYLSSFPNISSVESQDE